MALSDRPRKADKAPGQRDQHYHYSVSRHNVFIQVLKSMLIHKPVVLRALVDFSAGGDRLANHCIDFCPAFN
jgi:hypothetical protein